MLKKITIALSISIVLISCQSSEKPEEKPFDTLTSLVDQYANTTLQNGNINSISLAIYKDGDVYHNYYGSIDKGVANQANDSTLYEIASITKVFAGSLMARAVLEGKATLDDPVQDYLGADYANLAFEGTPIAIRHLVSHTLGLKERSPKGLAAVQEKVSEGYYQNRPFEYNFSDLLEELKTAELDKKPGTVYQYNSVGPELAVYILEKLYNKPYKELLNEFLVELDMNDTYLGDFDKHKDRLAHGYNEAGEIAPFSKNPLIGGAAGMISTLPDMIKFMKYQLESDDPMIKEATRELFKDEEDDITGYLWEGIGTAEEEGFYYSKTGTSSGVQSSLLLCPDSDYGLILIVNSTSEAAFMDWANLYFNKMESDLIKFPKINLRSLMTPVFVKDKELGTKEFNKLKLLEDKYFNLELSGMLNSVGYHLLASENTINEAIDMFTYAVSEFPENANLYDSLGEAYFVAKDYENSMINYKKSLELNPKNENAQNYLVKIDQLMEE